jgi:predicted TIM-barrel fold metal-dependent hydrolase
MHHHIIPPVYLEKARAQLLSIADTNPTPLLTWSPGPTLEAMDKYGVACAMVSVPPVWFGDPVVARDLARACNEYGARLMADHPGRFGLLAALPLPDQDASLAEIAYAFDKLGADGVCLTTSYDGKWPGDPAFRPVMDELNRRRAVVYIHPTSPACCGSLIPDMPPSAVEFVFDSTRALLSLMVSGTLQRCPDLRCVFAHTGGPTSVLATRISLFFNRHPELLARLPASPVETFRRQHYDIANSVNPATMAAALQFAGVERLLFGTDNPFVPIAATATAFDKFDMPADQKQAINRGNALKLFPRLNAA